MKAVTISFLIASVTIVGYGIWKNDLAWASIGLAVLSFSLAVAVHRESKMLSGQQEQKIDDLHGDVKAIRAHLAVPGNIAEARNLAQRIQDLEWKVDEVRKARRFSLFGDRYYAQGDWTRED